MGGRARGEGGQREGKGEEGWREGSLSPLIICNGIFMIFVCSECSCMFLFNLSINQLLNTVTR